MTKHSSDPAFGPSSRHPFQRPSNPGLSAAASGNAGFSGTAVTPLPATTAYLRTTRCAFPGCGKPADDSIHWPAED